MRRRLSIWTSVLMMLTLVQNISGQLAQSATTTFTKTVTVKDANGAPLPGAYVMAWGYTKAYDHNDFALDPVITNASGVAKVTISSNISNVNIIVEPPTTDLADATYNESDLDFSTESFDISLQAPTIKIDVVKSDGSAPTGHPYVSTDKNTFRLARPGVLGLAIDPASVSRWSSLNVGPDAAETPDQQWQSYSIKALTDSGTTNVKLFDDNNQEVGKSGINYVTSFLQANLSGALLTNTGAPFELPTGVTANVTITQLLKNDSIRSTYTYASVKAGNHPQWYAYIKDKTAAKYQVQVHFSNSLTLGDVVGQTFYTDSVGNFSLTADGSFTSTLVVDSRLTPTAPNIRFSFKDPSSGDLVNTSYSLWGGNKAGNVNISWNGDSSMKGALNLPDGTFTLETHPQSSSNLAGRTYTISVAGGAASILDESNQAPSSTDGVYDLVMHAYNFKFQLLDSANNPLDSSNFGWVSIATYDTKNKYWNYQASSQYIDPTTIGSYLPEGLSVLEPYSLPNSQYGSGDIYVTRTGSSFSVTTTNGSTTTIGDGVVQIPMKMKNLKFDVVDFGTPPKQNPDGYILVSPHTGSNDSTVFQPTWAYFGSRHKAFGSAFIPDGTWDITTYTINYGKNSDFISKKYVTTVTNGAVSIADASPDLNSIYHLTPAVPNLFGSIKNIDGSDLKLGSNQNVNVNLFQVDAKGGLNYQSSRWLWDSSNFAFSLMNSGTYQLEVSANGIDGVARSRSQFIYVNNLGKLSLTNGSGWQDTISNFNVNLKLGNLPLKLVNPKDNSLLENACINIWNPKGGFNTSNCVDPQTPGVTYLDAPTGIYQLQINTWGDPSLVPTTFDLVVDAGGVPTISLGGINVPKDGNKFIISPDTSNVTGRITIAAGTGLTTGWAGVDLQRYNSSTLTWEGTGKYSWADADGYFSIRASDVGIYRLQFKPYSTSDIGRTFSPSFEITDANKATFKIDFPSLHYTTTNLRVRVHAPDSNLDLSGYYMGLSPTDNSQYSNLYDWAQVYDTKEGGFTITKEGSYNLYLGTPWDGSLPNATPNNYTVVATKDANGNITATINPGTGVENKGSYYSLSLGAPNLLGTVVTSDSNTAVANSFITARNLDDGSSYGSTNSTDLNGHWAMNIPKGTYQVSANAPAGSVDYGISDPVGPIVVDATGAVTSVPNSMSATTIKLQLKPTTYKGVVNDALGTPVPYAGICINGFDLPNNTWTSFCAQANSTGNFGLSLPSNMTLRADSTMYVYDWQGNKGAPRMYKGDANITAALTSGVLAFKGANVKITVTANGVPVPNIWVNLDHPNIEWLANGSTDANGIASMYVEDLSQPLRATAYPYKGMAVASGYVNTEKTYTVEQIVSGTSGNIFSAPLALQLPNVNAIIRAPSTGSTPGAVLPGSWINVWDVTANEWGSGTGVGNDGTLGLYLKGGCACTSREYRLTVNPPGGSNASIYVQQQFTALVNSDGVVTITNSRTGDPVQTENLNGNTYLDLPVANPNFAGSVVDASGNPVRNSFVSAWGTGDKSACGNDCWSYTWSKSDGSFGLSLANGPFNAGAQAPWGGSGKVDSPRCDVRVTNGVLDPNSGSCVQPDGSVKFQLRAPNLTFTLKNGATTITNAWVSIGIGNWWTSARTGNDGTISLFIDNDAIAQNNLPHPEWGWAGYPSGSHLPIQVDVNPDGGSASEVVSWRCKSGDSASICNQLSDYVVGSDFPLTNLGNIQTQVPNIRVTVKKSTGAIPTGGGWMQLLNSIGGGNWSWDTWAQLNTAGVGVAYFDTSTVAIDTKYQLQLNPSWQDQNDSTAKIYDNNGAGLSFTEITADTYTLGAPDLRISVLSASSSMPNKWGSIWLEKVNPYGSTIRWVSGTTLGESAIVGYALERNSSYRATTVPGPGKTGTTTTCDFTVDGSGSVTLDPALCPTGSGPVAGLLTLPLARGNIFGTISGATPTAYVVGALVTAENISDSTETYATCTASDGGYGFNLKPGQTYQIKVFPVNKLGVAYADKTDVPQVVVSGGTNSPVNITLTTK